MATCTVSCSRSQGLVSWPDTEKAGKLTATQQLPAGTLYCSTAQLCTLPLLTDALMMSAAARCTAGRAPAAACWPAALFTRLLLHPVAHLAEVAGGDEALNVVELAHEAAAVGCCDAHCHGHILCLQLPEAGPEHLCLRLQEAAAGMACVSTCQGGRQGVGAGDSSQRPPAALRQQLLGMALEHGKQVGPPTSIAARLRMISPYSSSSSTTMNSRCMPGRSTSRGCREHTGHGSAGAACQG